MVRITASHLSQEESKTPPIKSIIGIGDEFKTMLSGYKEWLETLNYNTGTIYYSPVMVSEFLVWLATQGITSITEVKEATLKHYYGYLATRPHKRKHGRLKANTLRMHHQSLKRFACYLKQTGQLGVDIPPLANLQLTTHPAVFSRSEMEQLYASTTNDLLGIRDRAMLAVYYGCGLRRSEGAALETADILFDRNLVYVRKGKHYKERYVPMSGSVRADLHHYITYARLQLLNTPTAAFFINRIGHPLHHAALADRFKKLKTQAGIPKPGGLHALRHSIATHLLHSGMSLEQIRRFLGHSSLEATQRYTHLIDEEI